MMCGGVLWGGGEGDVEGGCCVVYICVGVAFCCVEVNVWEVYWFLHKVDVSRLGLR